MSNGRKIFFAFLWMLVFVLIGMEVPFAQGGVFSRILARWADFQTKPIPQQAPAFMSLITEADLKRLIVAGASLESFDFSGFQIMSEQPDKDGLISKLLRKDQEYVYRTEDQNGQLRRLTWGRGSENSISASYSEDGSVDTVLMDTEPLPGETNGSMAWLQFKDGEPYSVVLPDRGLGKRPLIFEYLLVPKDSVASRYVSDHLIVEYDEHGRKVTTYRLVENSRAWERYDQAGAYVGTGSLNKWMEFRTY